MLINAALTAILLTVLYIEEIKCTCGKRIVQYKQLIRKGSETSDGDWPWHSAIFHIGTNVDITYKCGGTLIGSSSVLTAAHCVFEFNRPIIPERILVELGKCNLLNSGTNSQQFQVYTVLLHPSYDSKTFKNDIAIIRLSTVATFNSFIQPICLWPSNLIDVNQIVGKYGTIVGWGLAESDKVSYILRKADMPVVSQIECLESNRELFGNFLSEKTFCAGSRNGTNACQGDSGGGLVFESDGGFYIRGIISIAKSERNMSCNTHDFVLFTDVAQYLTWIVQSVPELSVSQSHSGSAVPNATERRDAFTIFNNEELKEKRPPKPLYGEGQIVYNSTVVDLNYYSLPDEEICSKQVSINNKIQGKQLWSFLVAVFKYHAHADGIRISFHCNGILVSKRVVVTSAHSFRRPGQWYLPHEFFLSLGQQNIFSQRELAVKVQDIIIHPDFLLKDEFDADLALLIMSERVKYSDHIQPVCLWEGQNFVTTNKDEAILVGWARESQTQVPGESQTDIAPLASEEMCLRSNPVFSKIISDRTLCVGRRDNREACYISGAAMLMDTHKNGELVRQLRGILAASLLDPITNTCNLNDYFLATDLAKFADWIKYFIQNADLS